MTVTNNVKLHGAPAGRSRRTRWGTSGRGLPPSRRRSHRATSPCSQGQGGLGNPIYALYEGDNVQTHKQGLIIVLQLPAPNIFVWKYINVNILLFCVFTYDTFLGNRDVQQVFEELYVSFRDKCKLPWVLPLVGNYNFLFNWVKLLRSQLDVSLSSQRVFNG